MLIEEKLSKDAVVFLEMCIQNNEFHYFKIIISLFSICTPTFHHFKQSTEIISTVSCSQNAQKCECSVLVSNFYVERIF